MGSQAGQAFPEIIRPIRWPAQLAAGYLIKYLFEPPWPAIFITIGLQLAYPI